jgi:hypothetical protein
MAERDRYDMTEFVVTVLHVGRLGLLHRLDPFGHTFFPHEGVKMAVLAVAVSVIVVLRACVPVVHVSWRTVIELPERIVARQNFSNYVTPGLAQNPMALQDFVRGSRHGFHFLPVQLAEFPLHRHLAHLVFSLYGPDELQGRQIYLLPPCRSDQDPSQSVRHRR